MYFRQITAIIIATISCYCWIEILAIPDTDFCAYLSHERMNFRLTEGQPYTLRVKCNNLTVRKEIY